MHKLIGKIEGALDALDTDGLIGYVRLEIEELKRRDIETDSVTESIEIRRKVARLENYEDAFDELGYLIDDLKDALISQECLDSLAEELKERLCEDEQPEAREKFELSALETLEETLEPWKEER